MHLLLGLVIVLPLMEAIGFLLKFVQRQDVFIFNFIITINVCQGQLYKLATLLLVVMGFGIEWVDGM
jgi:hypothetical protein